MKGVTRKPFLQLSKRQQYNRLSYRKAALERNKNKTENKNISNASNNDNENDFIIEQDDVSKNQEAMNILSVMPSDQCNVNMSMKKISHQESEDFSTCHVVEDINIDSLSNFRNALQQYCLDMNINLTQTKALLRILRMHKCYKQLPKDSRTILKTPRSKIHFLSVGEGVYWHIGFVRILKKHLLLYDGELPTTLELELSTDGLSLTRNNPNKFWPIQYRVINIPDFKPLIAGIFKGAENPSDVHLFFEAFLEEVTEAKSRGGILIKNCRIPFTFRRFIGDAPARALVLNHKSHVATRPCSKCKVTGFKYNNTMVYLGINHEKRTDAEYAALIDEDHHKGNSPLWELSVSPVTGVPFEIMHLVYLGVAVRILDAWFKGKFGFIAKLPSYLIKVLSHRHLELSNWCPSEFARRPQPLEKYYKFKATEMRHFMLYASAIILLGVLNEEHYYHFLLLYVSMRILTSPKVTEENIKIAESALSTFVLYSQDLYDPSFVSYNVHCLQHLGNDAREAGSLENCSAFIYENNMPFFKKCIRNHPKPLQQYANRLFEKSNIQHKLKKKSFDDEFLSLIHCNGPLPTNVVNASYRQYNKYESTKFKFNIDGLNNYCMLEDGSICRIENILTWNSINYVYVRCFEKIDDFFNRPVKSSFVGVYKCKNLSENLKLVTVNNISAKCYCMPSWKESFTSIQIEQTNLDEYIVSTIIHSVQ